MIKTGIALGGGGAKGLAHIPMLEVLDEFGLKPHRIAGTSIGAIVGVLYASGHSGLQIREGINRISYLETDQFPETLKEKDLFKWFEFIDIDWSGSSLLKVDSFLGELMKYVKGARFEDLEIPMQIVAADFWKRSQVVFESGELRSAIHASMALPGIFAPVVIDGRVLVDGGVVNPVPFDLLQDCDLVIAVNVMGRRTESKGLVPGFSDAVFNSFQIMQSAILEQKLSDHPPDVYIAPDIIDIRVLEFYRADEIFRQSVSAKDELRRKIEAFLQTATAGTSKA